MEATPVRQPDTAGADNLSPVVPTKAADEGDQQSPNALATGANVPSASAPAQAANADAAVGQQQGGSMTPHNDGGATLRPTATPEQPALIARVEILKDVSGKLHVHGYAGRDLPATIHDDADEVRGAVDDLLTEHLA